jgi:hypothetical protein
MKNYLIILALVFSVGCTTFTAQPLNPAVYYRNDICFNYETGNVKEEKIKNFFKRFKKGKYRKTELTREVVEICGVGVLPDLEDYRIKVKAPAELDFFALTTCHEETTSENPDAGWKKKDGEVTFTYKPTMEKGKACPLYISAFNRKQRHSWGVLIFEHERYKLPARVYCNGYVEEYDGVSICQSREGLIQQVHFNEPVKLVSPVKGAADKKEACPVLGKDGQSSFEFKIPNRECFYGFIGMNSGNIHQLLTIGYEEIIVRD